MLSVAWAFGPPMVMKAPILSFRAFTAVRLPIMGSNSTGRPMLNRNDLRVELLQSIHSLYGCPWMGKNSTPVALDNVVDSKRVPRRVSAERSEESASYCSSRKSGFLVATLPRKTGLGSTGCRGTACRTLGLHPFAERKGTASRTPTAGERRLTTFIFMGGPRPIPHSSRNDRAVG